MPQPLLAPLIDTDANVIANQVASDTSNSSIRKRSENSDTAILSVDETGVVTACTQRAIDLLAHDPVGVRWSDLEASWASATRGGLETEPSRCSYVECQHGEGGAHCIVIIEHRKNQFARAGRVASEPASVLAHQLRTPLSAATLYLSRMADAKSLSAQHQKWLQRSIEQLVAAERMVGNLLMFSQDSAFATETLEIADVVSGVESSCEALLRRADITSHFLVADDDLPVLCNRVALVSALSNIVTNACQHAPGSSLTVTAEQGASLRCLITVHDSGPGFAPDFDFLASLQMDGQLHSGLGLAVARRVVEQHGGLLTAGNHPDGGALVRVELPLARCAADSVEVLI